MHTLIISLICNNYWNTGQKIQLRMKCTAYRSSQNTLISVSLCLLWLLPVVRWHVIYIKVNSPPPFCSAVPLYQDYCLQAVSGDPHRLNEPLLSEQLTSTCLQPLGTPRCSSGATSPQLKHPEEPSSSIPHPSPEVTLCSCWQDLDEVKASGLLSSMTTREVRLQEVWKV